MKHAMIVTMIMGVKAPAKMVAMSDEDENKQLQEPRMRGTEWDRIARDKIRQLFSVCINSGAPKQFRSVRERRLKKPPDATERLLYTSLKRQPSDTANNDEDRLKTMQMMTIKSAETDCCHTKTCGIVL